jgi:hypothetical protein
MFSSVLVCWVGVWQARYVTGGLLRWGKVGQVWQVFGEGGLLGWGILGQVSVGYGRRV